MIFLLFSAEGLHGNTKNQSNLQSNTRYVPPSTNSIKARAFVTTVPNSGKDENPALARNNTQGPKTTSTSQPSSLDAGHTSKLDTSAGERFTTKYVSFEEETPAMPLDVHLPKSRTVLTRTVNGEEISTPSPPSVTTSTSDQSKLDTPHKPATNQVAGEKPYVTSSGNDSFRFSPVSSEATDQTSSTNTSLIREKTLASLDESTAPIHSSFPIDQFSQVDHFGTSHLVPATNQPTDSGRSEETHL
jgi:hypothetical protein